MTSRVPSRTLEASWFSLHLISGHTEHRSSISGGSPLVLSTNCTSLLYYYYYFAFRPPPPSLCLLIIAHLLICFLLFFRSGNPEAGLNVLPLPYPLPAVVLGSAPSLQRYVLRIYAFRRYEYKMLKYSWCSRLNVLSDCFVWVQSHILICIWTLLRGSCGPGLLPIVLVCRFDMHFVYHALYKCLHSGT